MMRLKRVKVQVNAIISLCIHSSPAGCGAPGSGYEMLARCTR
jgi:hypothetical protein